MGNSEPFDFERMQSLRVPNVSALPSAIEPPTVIRALNLAIDAGSVESGTFRCAHRSRRHLGWPALSRNKTNGVSQMTAAIGACFSVSALQAMYRYGRALWMVNRLVGGAPGFWLMSRCSLFGVTVIVHRCATDQRSAQPLGFQPQILGRGS